jgi:ribosomal protein L7/L12
MKGIDLQKLVDSTNYVISAHIEEETDEGIEIGKEKVIIAVVMITAGNVTLLYRLIESRFEDKITITLLSSSPLVAKLIGYKHREEIMINETTAFLVNSLKKQYKKVEVIK